MSVTKILPVPFDPVTGATTSQFLIPRLSPLPAEGFVRVTDGASVARGALVYIGVAVSPEEILDRYARRNQVGLDRVKALAVLDRYLLLLQNFSVGNVLSIHYLESGDFVLVKEANRPPQQPGPKLPG